MKTNKYVKRLLLFAVAALMLIGVANVVNAAHIELGNAASTSYESYVPFYGYYDYGWSAVIYLQSELGGANDFIALTYDVYDSWTGAPYTIYDQKVYMKHTTDTDWVGNLAKPDPVADGYTLVYEGDITFTATGFADTISLDTSFSYNGVDNVVILWENWDGDYASGQPRWQYPGSSYAPDRVKYRYADGSMPGDGYLSYYFPNIRIHYPGDHDVALKEIVSPEDTEGLTTAPVTINVKNTGLNTETFPVNVKIDAPPLDKVFEDFEGSYATRPLPPPGWVVEDTNGDGLVYTTYVNNMWGTYYSSSYANSGTMSVRCEDGGSLGNDDWLFTNTFTLDAGTTYSLEWYDRMSSSYSSYDNAMEVWIGTAQSSGAMTTMLWSDYAMYHTSHQLEHASVSVPTTGTYVIGFHRINGYSYSDLYLDDIHLYIPGSTIYDQTLTMNNLGPGAVSQLDFPAWTPSTTGTYAVTATTLLSTDVATYDDVKTKDVTVGLYDAALISIDIPKPLMGPAPFSPQANVSNAGSLDSLIPVHATIADPSGGTGVVFEEDFEGDTAISEFQGDVVVDINFEDIVAKYGEYQRIMGTIIWPEDEPPLGSPSDWTILNPDQNGAYWHPTDYTYTSADTSMYCGDEGTRQYLPDSYDIMISPKIHVGTAGGAFDFNLINDVEGAPYDYLLFGASPDGLTWGWWFGSSYWFSWMTAAGIPIFPTDVDANGDCYIGYAFISDNTVQYEGVYIDDVVVSGSPYLYDETVFANIAAGETGIVDFPEFTPLDGYENYVIDICCEDPKDAIPANDCASLAFTTGAPVYILETGYGYNTIQDAIDDALPGQTVIATDGTFYEDVNINKEDLTVTGENSPFDGTSYLYGQVQITADGVTLQNFYIQPLTNFTDNAAAVMVYASDVLIQENIIGHFTGHVDPNMGASWFTIKGIHVYGGPQTPLRNIEIRDNVIEDIINYNVTATGGGGGSDVELLHEGFESGFPPSGWSTVVTNAYTWELSSYDPYMGTYNAHCVYDPYYTGVQDEWMISPSIDLSGMTAAQLDFAWMGSYYWSVSPYNNCDMNVAVSTDGGSSWDYLWNEDGEGVWTNWVWYTKTLDLSAYLGQTIVVGVNYNGYDGAEMGIDEIVLTATPSSGGGGSGALYGGADGIMVQGYVVDVVIDGNTIENVHSKGWGYGVEVTPTASTALSTKPTQYTFYESDFEADDGGWIPTATWDPVGDWEWTDSYNYALYTQTHSPPTAAHSGDGLWGTVVHADYTNSGGESLLSQTFDFTGLEGVELRFWEWSDLFGSWDYGEVFVNGDQVHYIDSYPGTAWDEVVIDLSAYDDLPSVEIVFSMHASTVVEYAGWYIDDLMITTETAPLEPQQYPQLVEITCNEFDHIGDGSVLNSHAYPGICVSIDETAPEADDGSAELVEVHCNSFGLLQVAMVNKDPDATLNATNNWYGDVTGPSGGAQDPYSGIIANGYGAAIIPEDTHLGPIHFTPYLGVESAIIVSTTEAEVGEPITFTADAWALIFDECCDPYQPHMQFEWDFDDGTYSHNPTTTHVYETAGTYHVRLMVDTPGFGWFTGTMFSFAYEDIEVVPADTPFTANADGGNLGGYEGVVGEDITFIGTAIGGDAPYIYRWNFGDGSPERVTEGSTIEYQYRQPGTYTATLTVTDSSTNTVTDTVEVIVTDIDELYVNIPGTYNYAQGEMIQFAGTVAGGKGPYSYNWNFGDGVTSTLKNPTHVYENSGTYTATLSVTDALGLTKTSSKTVTIDPVGGTSEVEITDVSGGFLLSATINSDETVAWSIDVEGMVFLGGHADGTAEQGSSQVRLPFTFGLGSVDITIAAGGTTETFSAFMIGPFVLM